MSFGFGIGDCIAVLNLVGKIRRRFVDSPVQFRAACDEVKSLSNVLRDLEDVFPERSLTDEQTASLEDIIQGCNKVLQDLDACLDNYQELSGKASHAHAPLGTKSPRFWKRLKFEPDDVKDLRSRLQSHVGMLHAFIERIDIGLSYAIKDGVDRLNIRQDDQHFLTILEWLSDTNFPAQQNDTFNRCQEGTGRWLLESNEYKAWIDGLDPLLFCPGIPGAGKTFITSIVIKDLHKRLGSDPEIGIAYLFLNYKRQAEQTLEKLTASLLKQLLRGRLSSFAAIESLYEKHTRKQTRPSLSELQGALVMVSSQMPRIFILIDAADECTMSSVRSAFLKDVIALQSQGNIGVFVTSRFLPEITSVFQGRPSIEIRATEGDVKRYLENHMVELPKCVQRNEELQRTVVSEITKAVDGMFLLAQLHIGSLSGKTTTKAVKIALQKLPKESDVLDKAYRDALVRIEEQMPERHQLAKQILYWIVYAARQLRASELQEALAVEEGTSELDEENKPDFDEMISVCMGLVTIDPYSNVIRLVHYTTQEFLENLPDWAQTAHSAITRTCLAYLAFNICEAGFLDRDFFRNHSLSRYACDYWYTHAESCWNESMEALALAFVEEERKIVLDCDIFDDLKRLFPHDYHVAPSWTGLRAIHWAAYVGSEKIVSALLENGHDPRLMDDRGGTPLLYAALRGNEAVSKILLEMPDMDVNVTDNAGNTPLCLAAHKGHEPVVRLLLEQQSVDVNLPAKNGYTPLLATILYGDHSTIVQLLTSIGNLDVNCIEKDFGRSSLHIACANARNASMRILLKRKDLMVNILIDRRSKDETDFRNVLQGYTPLMLAAVIGNETAIKALLEEDALDTAYRCSRGRTALMLAYDRGYESTVKLLEDAGAEGELPPNELRSYVGRLRYPQF
ncbi:MAG: hypothetical protein Q9202_005947 [Teloschistes flavicans]